MTYEFRRFERSRSCLCENTRLVCSDFYIYIDIFHEDIIYYFNSLLVVSWVWVATSHLDIKKRKKNNNNYVSTRWLEPSRQMHLSISYANEPELCFVKQQQNH